MPKKRNILPFYIINNSRSNQPNCTQVRTKLKDVYYEETI